MITRQMQTERLDPPNIMDTKKATPRLRLPFRVCLTRFLVLLCKRSNRNVALVVLTTLECYDTVNQSVESVVTTHTDGCTGIMICTTLTYDDITGLACLATPDFNTKSLAS